MEHFFHGCSYYLPSTGEQVAGIDLSQFDDLNISDSETTETEEFNCHVDFEVDHAGWKLQFKNAIPQEGGDGNYYLWLSNKDGGVPFKAVVEQLDCNVGKVHHRHELVSEKDEKGELVKHEDGPLGAFIRYNITLLEPSELEEMRKEFKSVGTIGEAGQQLRKNLVGYGAARHQNFTNVLKQLGLGKRNFDLEFRVGVLDDGENCEITEGDWKLRFSLGGLLPPIVRAHNVRISHEQTFWLSFGLSKKGEGVPFKAVADGVFFFSKKEGNSHCVKIRTVPFGSLRVIVELL
ncbi:Oidioi.mRNA.OKI2018_I69.chr1.g3783.t1.cds [Oikopleura dioica]|uniref:Oidioi.mRNA.OKI2018_I69.chr1.g3783.t1.cds n=1 Tax=Oikopleura dioica TaxID=34765 RepID=A0ABN7SVA2_OIKDI|nr:Oidioi.mRNA.OKI2018_I69.chr1.g3783.t1.cds [Oikopleura dioica]